MAETYDWIIVGGGPAGSTLGKLLSKMGKVLLLDRRRLDIPWDTSMPGKCCGGLLAPDAQKILAESGLSLPKEVLSGPQIFTVRAIDLNIGLERYYQRFYLNLEREKFDRWLSDLAIESGVTARFGAEWLSFDCNEVRYRWNGEVRSAKCRFLIAADGAAGSVRRKFSGENEKIAPASYVAVQEQYELKVPSPFFSAFFDRELTDFYGWSIPKSDLILLGAAFAPNSDAIRKFALLKSRLEARGMVFGKRIRREGSMLRRPLKRSDVWLGKENIFAVGEAAGWISPSSAEGFSYAFRSAKILANLFREKETPDISDYRERCAALYRNLFFKKLKMPFLYSPLLRKHIMKSGLTAIHIES